MKVACPKCATPLILSPAETARQGLRSVLCKACGNQFDARRIVAGAAAPGAPGGPIPTGTEAGATTGTPATRHPSPVTRHSDGLEPMPPDAAAAEIARRKGELAASRPARNVPKKIGDYVVIAELNRGGMGIVYKAMDPHLKRLVAIKVLLAGEGADDEDFKRFRREAQASARLQHPNIVQIFAIGTHEDKPYLVMDFVEGKTAKQLKDQGKMSPRLALSIIEGCAEALHHAHLQGVIHRDVKPANIMVDKHERAQLMDFGLARRVDEDLEVTKSGTTMGTPSYMSPEQAEGKLHEVDGQSDLYSAGACLYELLTGRGPFEADTIMATLQKILDEPPVPPRKLNPKIHRDVETICLKCLEKDKRNRYANARQLAEDIRRFNAGEAILAKPLGPLASAFRKARRHKEITIAVVLGVVSLAAALGYSVNESRRIARNDAELRAKALDAALGTAAQSLSAARNSVAELETPARGDFPEKAAAARTAIAQAEAAWRQAEGLAPDNPAVRHALSGVKELENRVEVRRFIFKARAFLYPPPGRAEDPPVLPNFAGAEFAAQEAVDRDPQNAEARQLLRAASGIRAVSIDSSPAGAEVLARRVLDGYGRQLPPARPEDGGEKGKPLGRTPIKGRELDPGLYVVTFERAGAGRQQAALLVSREAKDEDLILSVPLGAREENMAWIPDGSATVPQVGPVKVPAFAIDRFEYPNRAGTVPLTGATLLEAKGFCGKQDKALCSTAQWLRACMGEPGEQRRYPYGRTYVSRHCAAGLDADAQPRALPSGSYPRCRTPEGVYDMSGNVAEWTDTEQEDSVFGGDWTSPARFADLTVSCIARSLPDQVNKDRLGFRCCKAP